MSSSYRNWVPAVWVAGATLLPGASAVAAEVYVQPQAEVHAEVDSNRNLIATGNKFTSEGYSGTVGALWGIATPLSETQIRPQLGYVDYPKDHEHDLQGSLDFSSNYHDQRNSFSLAGSYGRADTYISELASALFGTVISVSPTTPETARITTNTTRSLGNIVPKYEYQVSPRTRIGVSGVYEDTQYNGDFADQYVSYDYGKGSVYLEWEATPRTDVSIGPYISRDAAKVGGASTDGVGGDLGIEYKITRVFSGRLDLTDERDDIRVATGSPKTSSNNFGATYLAKWTGQVSQLQLSAGRTLSPSGAGGTYRTDQVQLEYDRNLTERVTSYYAVRYIKAAALSPESQSANYRYGDGEVGFKWMVTRTWYLGGGAQFLWVGYDAANSSANNGMVYVSFGYLGLGRRP
jgi:hypothetical protein